MSPAPAPVMSESPAHVPVVSPDERYDPFLALARIVPSKTNPRTHFDDAYISELAHSIADKGVMQPIVVRQQGERFEIVAGECRYRASKVALLTGIPAMVRSYTDEQVLELQLIENIHRRDLTPLEQAKGYRRLIDTNPDKHSAASIAQRLGLSPQWVWDRMKLNDLSPEAKRLLEQERMSVGHAILIARLKPEDQARVIEPGTEAGYGTGGLWQHEDASLLDDDESDRARAGAKPDKYNGLKAATIRELEHWINDHIRFDVHHAAKAVPFEFEDLAKQVEAAVAQPGRGKKVVAISFDAFTQPDARTDEERTFGPRSFKRADGSKKTQYVYGTGRHVDSPTCEHSVLGVVAAGDRRGESFDVCIARDKCEVHWKKEIAEKKQREKSGSSGKVKSAAKAREAEQRRQEREAAAEREREARWKKFRPALHKAVNDAFEKLGAKLPTPMYAKVLAFHRLPKATKPAELALALLAQVINDTFDRSWHGYEKDMVALATLLKVDVKACEPKAEAGAVQTSGVKAAAAKKGKAR